MPSRPANGQSRLARGVPASGLVRKRNFPPDHHRRIDEQIPVAGSRQTPRCPKMSRSAASKRTRTTPTPDADRVTPRASTVSRSSNRGEKKHRTEIRPWCGQSLAFSPDSRRDHRPDGPPVQAIADERDLKLSRVTLLECRRDHIQGFGARHVIRTVAIGHCERSRFS